jgi:hypothetical protein
VKQSIRNLSPLRCVVEVNADPLEPTYGGAKQRSGSLHSIPFPTHQATPGKCAEGERADYEPTCELRRRLPQLQLWLSLFVAHESSRFLPGT